MILEKETRSVFHAQQRESVIQVPKRNTSNIKSCTDENQDTSEEELDNLDDPKNLKYLHKKFSTKKREWTRFVKILDSDKLEDDPLEGTSRGTDPLHT